MVFLYRKNGGQVLGVSTDSGAYIGVDAAYYGTVIDPSTPNGVDISSPKIYDGTLVRTPTSLELLNFDVAAVADDNLQQRTAALALATTNPIQRKILIGIVSVMIDEINALRQWDASLKSAVAASTSFANMQTRIAALAATPDRTLAQAKTAITNTINGGTVD